MKLTPQALTALFANHNADPKHERVLDAAQACFLDFGVKRTSMGEIAKRSGISPATLYRWFDGKDALVMGVIAREARRFLADLDAHLNLDAPPDEQLIEASVLVLARIKNRPLLDRLYHTEPEVILPELTLEAAPLMTLGATYLTMHLQRLVAAGKIPELHAAPTAEILTRVIHSLLLTPSTTLPLEDEAQVRIVFGDIIRRLLKL